MFKSALAIVFMTAVGDMTVRLSGRLSVLLTCKAEIGLVSGYALTCDETEPATGSMTTEPGKVTSIEGKNVYLLES